MEEILTYSQVKGYDPTHTTALRNAFAKNMSKRFTELAMVVKKSVYDNDCFGLKEKRITVLQMTLVPSRGFDFPRSSEKIDAFMAWLQKQVDNGIIQVGTARQIGRAVESAWMNLYILDSYKRGIIRARYELNKAGVHVPSVEENGGINMVLNTPFHIDRVGLLFTRVFTDLKGITDAMDMQISRILAQGMVDGDGPALLARKLVATINGTGAGELGITDTLGRFIPASRRAETLTRTEIIRAHHIAMMQEYQNWGLDNIIVQGEWKTAGDGRVCQECEDLDGKIFSLDEITGMIPYHPNCRCIALPYIEELQKYKE
jgi:SPP1 gp7 family putative phage head morphogenesis protein